MQLAPRLDHFRQADELRFAQMPSRGEHPAEKPRSLWSTRLRAFVP